MAAENISLYKTATGILLPPGKKNEVPPSNARVTVRHIVAVTQNASCYSLLTEQAGILTVNTGMKLEVLSNY